MKICIVLWDAIMPLTDTLNGFRVRIFNEDCFSSIETFGFQCNFRLNRFCFPSDEIGTPSAPALVADSLTATSLSLEWEIPVQLTKLMKQRPHVTQNFLVQWRYEEIGNDWKFCRNQSMGADSLIHVKNLQPFTKYRVSVIGREVNRLLNNFRSFNSFVWRWFCHRIVKWNCIRNRVWS